MRITWHCQTCSHDYLVDGTDEPQRCPLCNSAPVFQHITRYEELECASCQTPTDMRHDPRCLVLDGHWVTRTDY